MGKNIRVAGRLSDDDFRDDDRLQDGDALSNFKKSDVPVAGRLEDEAPAPTPEGGVSVFDRTGFGSGHSFKTSRAIINPAAKEPLRRWLQCLVDKFLEAGGVITIVPFGKWVKSRPANLGQYDFGRFKPWSAQEGYAENQRETENLEYKRWRDPLPSKQEQWRLVRASKAGDEQAKTRLVQSFQRLILFEADQYHGPPFKERVAEGHLGLFEAIARFDETKGCALSTYARPWIKKRISECAKAWAKGGNSSETRADRYLFSHPDASEDEIVAATKCTLQSARDAIQAARASMEEHYSTTGNYEDDGVTNHGDDLAFVREPNTSDEEGDGAHARQHFHCFSRHQLSPQLLIHNASNWPAPSRPQKQGTASEQREEERLWLEEWRRAMNWREETWRRLMKKYRRPYRPRHYSTKMKLHTRTGRAHKIDQYRLWARRLSNSTLWRAPPCWEQQRRKRRTNYGK
jgi:DNA-directed RNA polymerase specialized sigma subunit